MSEQTTSKKITVGLILNWIFGVLFGLTGIVSVFSEPIPGIVMLVMAAILLPPVTKLVDQKWKFHLSRGMKIVVIIIGCVIFGATIDTSNVSTTQQAEPQKEEQQATRNEDVVNKTVKTEQVNEEQPQTEVNEQATNKEKTETIPSGLNLSRTDIVNVLEKPAIGFLFEKGAPVNGRENFVANKGGSVVQLIGPSENLQEVSTIALLGNDAGENMTSLAMVVGIANVIDQSSVDWISSEFEKVASNPTSEYSNSKIFGDKIFKIQFTPSDFFNSFSLVVTPSS